MSIVDTAIVVGLTVASLVALALLVWTLALKRRRELYIAPFHVAGGQSDPALGVALANMLRARLERLQRELTSARQVLEQEPQTPAGAANDPRAIALPTSITVPRGVFEPVNIDVSIGSVAVGGLLSWLQRWAIDARTLQFTVFFEEDRAIVSARVEALAGAQVKDVWIETGASAEQIVTSSAHALLQSVVSDSSHGPIEALSLEEFEELLSSLYQLAEINRRATSGGNRRDTIAKSSEIVDRLGPLAARFPDWHPLLRLVANVAERAGRIEEARQYRNGVVIGANGAASGEEGAAEADEDERSNREDEFVHAVRSFAERVFPGDPPPDVGFGNPLQGTNAWWDGENNRYEVDLDAETPDLRGYVALMGHFMLKHYHRCFTQAESPPAIDLWNEFRFSVVDYLLVTDPEVPVETSDFNFELLRALHALDARPDVERAGVRALATALLDGFSCDWTAQNLPEKIAAINVEQGTPVPEAALEEALTAVAAAPAS